MGTKENVFDDGRKPGLLNNLYQVTMDYAYWKAGKQSERSVFDLYFRKNPSGVEYTIFAELEECIKVPR
ncbi:hypothetical protein YC2023_050383 [Brassica napus]